MRYYIPVDLRKVNIRALSNLARTTDSGTLLLGENGLYRSQKGGLYQFKIFSGKTTLINNYLGDLDLICDDVRWKKVTSSYQIPFLHHTVKVETHHYRLAPKSNTALVIEEANGKISDLYFESREGHDNHFVKEDIRSFLSLLK